MNWKINDKNLNLALKSSARTGLGTGNISDQSFSLHPVILKLLAQRGAIDAKKIKEFISPDYETGVLDPFLFVDMQKAMDRLKEVDKKQENILISFQDTLIRL